MANHDEYMIKEVIDDLNLAEAMEKSLSAEDNSVMAMLGAGLGGVLEFPEVITTSTGRPLLRKNLVVQRGRTFALEKIHGMLVPVDAGYVRNLDRTISFFGIGTGGTPADKPFNPNPVAHTDMGLTTQVPFRIVDPADPATNIPTEDQASFPFFTTNATKKEYRYKKIDKSASTFVVNKADNKIYCKLPLMISPLDARNQKINELALFIASATNTDIEMYSRSTFDTESMSQATGKGLLVNYYTYA